MWHLLRHRLQEGSSTRLPCLKTQPRTRSLVLITVPLNQKPDCRPRNLHFTSEKRLKWTLPPQFALCFGGYPSILFFLNAANMRKTIQGKVLVWTARVNGNVPWSYTPLSSCFCVCLDRIPTSIQAGATNWMFCEFLVFHHYISLTMYLILGFSKVPKHPQLNEAQNAFSTSKTLLLTTSRL